MTATALPVLMALRVKGRADAEAVAMAAGSPVAEVRAALERACGAGTVRRAVHGGGYALTDEGRAELAALIAAEGLDRAALAVRYERFVAADAELKARITAWQLAAAPGGEPAAALVALGRAAADVARDLGCIAPRLLSYAQRLDAATRALGAGDTRFAASPRVDSLHQIWFELHEDLLVTLGRTRAP